MGKGRNRVHRPGRQPDGGRLGERFRRARPAPPVQVSLPYGGPASVPVQSHPMDGCRAKVERAQQHLAELHLGIREFFERGMHAIALEQDPATGEQVYKVRVAAQPPRQWGAVVGDVVHNFRAALDHLAYQLVLANGATPTARTAFPVFSDPKKYETTGVGQIQGAAPAAVALIESLQPYHSAPDTERHLLVVLHALDIIDKHRALNLTAAVLRSGIAFSGPTTHIASFSLNRIEFRGPIEDGTEVFRYLAGPDAVDMDVQTQFTFRIALGEEAPIPGVPVEGLLEEIGRFVVAVLDRFAHFFPPVPTDVPPESTGR